MTLQQIKSQSQMSRVTASQEKCIETSCLEIFFSLRRCLTQQSEIRSKLYQVSSIKQKDTGDVLIN